MDMEELEQTTGATGYVSAKQLKHSKMEDAFMSFVPATSARDAVFVDTTTMNGNLTTQLGQKEDHIRYPQAEMCNLKVAEETRTADGGGSRNGGEHSNTQRKNKDHNGHLTSTRKI